MTYIQLKAIQPASFIQILLKYRLHFIANEICRELKYPSELIALVYENWACCQVQSDNQDESVLAEEIKNQLQSEKSVSFTEIARRALQVGKPDLALLLLDNEPAVAKRVPALISMAYDETKMQKKKEIFTRTLKESLKSRDSDLIYLVITKLVASDISSEEVYQMLWPNANLKQHLQNYLRQFQPIKFQEYLNRLGEKEPKMYKESAYFALEKAQESKKASERKEWFNLAREYLLKANEKKDSPMIKVIETEIKLIGESNTDDQKNVQNQQAPPPPSSQDSNEAKDIQINTILGQMMAHGQTDDAIAVQKQLSISKKRMVLLQVQTLIAEGNWDDLEEITDHENKEKDSNLPYEIVADILMDLKQEDAAIQYIMKMQDVDESITILKRLNRPRDAAKVLANNQSWSKLKEWRDEEKSSELRTYIDTLLAKKQ